MIFFSCSNFIRVCLVFNEKINRILFTYFLVFIFLPFRFEKISCYFLFLPFSIESKKKKTLFCCRLYHRLNNIFVWVQRNRVDRNLISVYNFVIISWTKNKSGVILRSRNFQTLGKFEMLMYWKIRWYKEISIKKKKKKLSFHIKWWNYILL